MKNKIGTVGHRIKVQRIKANITQAELGAMAGISAATICHFETGRYDPRARYLTAIATALGVPVSVFFGE